MQLGRFEVNQIYNEDCYKAIKELPDKSIDLVIIDPPYLMDTRGGGFHKKRDYYDIIENEGLSSGINIGILIELERVMKATNIYIFCNKNLLSILFNFYKNKNIDLLVWNKTNPIPTINNKYLSDIEYVLFARDEGVKLHGDYSTLSKIYISDVNKKDKEKYEHPTIKPCNLIERYIYNSSKKGDVVLDCFLGSGTTAVACKHIGRNYIGFEINKKWFDIATNRLNNINAHGQTSMFTI